MNKQREQTKIIFDSMTPLLFDEKYDQVVKILDELDVNNLEGQILVSYLSVTNPWKKYLNPARLNFIKKAEQILIKEIGELRTEQTLKGFK